MSQQDAVIAAEAAIAKMLVGIKHPGMRQRAEEFATAALTIAGLDCELIDGLVIREGSSKPVRVDRAGNPIVEAPVATVPTVAYSVNPGGV